MATQPIGPYVVWQDGGDEGWNHLSYPSLKEALLAHKYNAFVITRLIDFEPVEKSVNEP